MGSNGMIIIFVIIGIIIAVMIPIMIKKKRSERNKLLISARHNKDEVWKSIKQYLKDTGRYGNKIISSYVAKRNDISYISPNESSYTRTKQKYVNKIREYQYSCEKKLVRQTNKKAKFTRPPVRDLYVVCFQTENTKTGEVFPPQAIECEVVVRKIDRKNQDRQIFINGSCDYNKEMEWIAPIRDAEIARNRKIEEKQAQKQEKLRLKMEKQFKKEKVKKEKNNGKIQ